MRGFEDFHAARQKLLLRKKQIELLCVSPALVAKAA
jgi:hypothetical protein